MGPLDVPDRIFSDLDGNRVGVELQLPVDRLSISFKQTVDEQHFPAERPQLRDYVLQHVPLTVDGRPFVVDFRDMAVHTIEKVPYLVVHLNADATQRCKCGPLHTELRHDRA